MKIQSLISTKFDDIYKAFSLAFSDYEIQLDSTQLRNMLKRRGFNPALSFAAFENNEIISFTLNGIGYFNGKLTAYDTGTGTLKDYRGKGLASQIFAYSIPYLKESSVQQYLLEVLQHNHAAISIYKILGFEITREFNYFIQKNEEISFKHNSDNTFAVQQVDISQISSLVNFWDFQPSWQNSIESIHRSIDNFVCLGVLDKNKIIGYCVFEPTSGDITHLSVDKNYRRKGIASELLKAMVHNHKIDTIKAVNTEVSCNSITAFLNSHNIPIKGKQFEMIKNI